MIDCADLFEGHVCIDVPELTARMVRQLKGEQSGDAARTERDIEAIPHVLNEGDFAVDAGACWGQWTLPMKKAVGTKGTVVAFEPYPTTFSVLKASLKVFEPETGHIILSNLALDDSKTLHEADMALPPEGSPDHDWARTPLGFAKLRNRPNFGWDRTESVWACSLDHFIRLMNLPKPLKFIKLDTEGSELTILKGAERILERDKPIIMAEVEGRHVSFYGHTTQDIFDWLSQKGYEPFLWRDSAFHAAEFTGSDNYWFFPKDFGR